MSNVYEICDCTDDEMYYPLGIFPDRETALSAIKEADDKKEKVSDRAEEYEVIKIFEREFGWSEHGVCIITIEREDYYDENDDEYYWRRVVI